MGDLTRAAVLDQARDCVTRDRAATHGRPENSFGAIAALWSADLGLPITAIDVARMMVLFKLARAKGNPGHADNWIDAAGYAAIGGELGAPERVVAPREESAAEVQRVVVEPQLDARGWPYAMIRVAGWERDGATFTVVEPSAQQDSGPAVADAPPEPGAGGGAMRAGGGTRG